MSGMRRSFSPFAFCLAFCLALLGALTPSSPAYAIGVDVERLANPEQEAQARMLMKELRCLVCQNQSIEDSNAPLAQDLRRIVRTRIAAGDTPEQVKAYLVARYGTWVLLRPPFNPRTWLLWTTPLLLLLAGGFIAWRHIKRNAALSNDLMAPPSLSLQEQEELQRLTPSPPLATNPQER
jgi:cytochrome c-type biogenesis protein CcmH